MVSRKSFEITYGFLEYLINVIARVIFLLVIS